MLDAYVPSMKSKATILGHPIHPMLVGFPVAFYVATLAAYSLYGFTGDHFAFRVGVIANVVGVATAALAAIPGTIDWAFAIPNGHPAKSLGLEHMTLNVSALVLFGIDAYLQIPLWNATSPAPFIAIGLAGAGVILTLAAGYLGWKMVQAHHVGIDFGAARQIHGDVAVTPPNDAPVAPRP